MIGKPGTQLRAEGRVRFDGHQGIDGRYFQKLRRDLADTASNFEHVSAKLLAKVVKQGGSVVLCLG